MRCKDTHTRYTGRGAIGGKRSTVGEVRARHVCAPRGGNEM